MHKFFLYGGLAAGIILASALLAVVIMRIFDFFQELEIQRRHRRWEDRLPQLEEAAGAKVNADCEPLLALEVIWLDLVYKGLLDKDLISSDQALNVLMADSRLRFAAYAEAFQKGKVLAQEKSQYDFDTACMCLTNARAQLVKVTQQLSAENAKRKTDTAKLKTYETAYSIWGHRMFELEKRLPDPIFRS